MGFEDVESNGDARFRCVYCLRTEWVPEDKD